ncbi:MAG: radical SAM protein [Candidatus Omnitrophica bacterium]|nr:radical SAM protein [Candidatus Omnitrophota bacterium]
MKSRDNKVFVTDRLDSKLHSESIPFGGKIELTHGCNLKCKHCFIPQKNNIPELKTSDFIRLIDEIHAAGTFSLCFTGGEPFLREDFLDIYSYARRKGFFISIFTNATLITGAVAKELCALPPQNIEVTLNGITEDIYEGVTGVKGSFKKAMEAIYIMRDKRLPVTVKANGMKINRSQILEIKKFSERVLGKSRFRCDLVIYPGLNGSKEPLSLRLSEEEIMDILYKNEDMRSSFVNIFCNAEHSPWLEGDFLFLCGLNTFQIDPWGRLRICPFLKDSYEDLAETGFLEGFRRLRANLRSLKFETDSRCRGCELARNCLQCPGRALAEGGSMEKPVEFFCSLAHKHAEKVKELTRT